MRGVGKEKGVLVYEVTIARNHRPLAAARQRLGNAGWVDGTKTEGHGAVLCRDFASTRKCSENTGTLESQGEKNIPKRERLLWGAGSGKTCRRAKNSTSIQRAARRSLPPASCRWYQASSRRTRHQLFAESVICVIAVSRDGYQPETTSQSKTNRYYHTAREQKTPNLTIEAGDGLVSRRSRSGRAILRLAGWLVSQGPTVSLPDFPEPDRSGQLRKRPSRVELPE
ncbi:hypothetical protein QBC40DRAFT_333847 [Triangularia verruculosa]|uniref:Uncharacterized protein n=1 Tax=Triangularia verruculosa TaxID=2587418 RepID=A0AAN6XC36_9PEZI|nr:hypothetical protein QBC40DRAFT_333847 [Triangularia verruculosa]